MQALVHPRPRHRSLVSAVLVVALVATSCLAATVRRVVTESNAAMLGGCRLEAAEGAQPGDCWKASVAEIDEFIAAHPDQPVTINALRLRQGLLLTVHRQDALAKASFDAVAEKQLKTDRDKALFALREHLMWWYREAPAPASGSALPFDAASRARVAAAVEDIDLQLAGLDGAANTELRWYLETLRASMVARKSSDTTTIDGHGNPVADVVAQVTLELEQGMKRFAALFSEADVAWMTDGSQADGAGDSLLLLRRRVEGRELIRRYKSVAARKRLTMAWDSDPTWTAAWITQVP